MYSEIHIEQLLNSTEELNHFPIEGIIRTSFIDGRPDDYLLNKYIYLIRHDDKNDIPNIGLKNIEYLGDINLDRFDVVKTENTILENDGKWTVEVKPIEALVPNASYYLIISKDLRPKHYIVEKINSVGSSSIQVLTSDKYNSEDATFVITITQQSQLSTGSHIIEFDVLKNGLTFKNNIRLDIKHHNFNITPGVDVVFNSDVPFLVDESFRIICKYFNRLGNTLVQEIKTTLNSKVIQPSPEIQSKRIQEHDLLKFYEEFGWSRRLSKPNSQDINTKDNIVYNFIHPNIFIIKFEKELKISSITQDIFNIDIGYAFDNYMLDNMGLYNSKQQYLIKYYIVDNKTIKLVINTKDYDPNSDKIVIIPG